METKRRLLLSLSLSLLILSAVMGVLLGNVQALLDRPIKRVKVTGALQYVSSQQVQQQLEFLLTQSFMSLDLPKVKLALEKHPWIAGVSLSRRWPDELFVLIEEQVPIARWNSNGFINGEGDVVNIPHLQQAELTQLPQINGRKKNAVELLGFYRQANQLLTGYEWHIVELTDSRHSGHTVSIEHSSLDGFGQPVTIELSIPFENSWSRLLSCLDILGQTGMADKLPYIQNVDLRYADGFSIKWKPNYPNSLSG